jgi:hypothetical protein
MTLAAEELAAVSVQQNDDMRKITAWVAIVAVPTAVTGYFGQNVPYPGLRRNLGLPRVGRDHADYRCQSVHRVQTQEMALNASGHRLRQPVA